MKSAFNRILEESAALVKLHSSLFAILYPNALRIAAHCKRWNVCASFSAL